MIPALLTSTSMRPKRSWAAWTSRSSWASSDTSVGTTSVSMPGLICSQVEAMRSSWLWRRAASTRCAPRRANSSASASPIPADAPVISTTFPAYSSSARRMRRRRATVTASAMPAPAPSRVRNVLLRLKALLLPREGDGVHPERDRNERGAGEHLDQAGPAEQSKLHRPGDKRQVRYVPKTITELPQHAQPCRPGPFPPDAGRMHVDMGRVFGDRVGRFVGALERTQSVLRVGRGEQQQAAGYEHPLHVAQRARRVDKVLDEVQGNDDIKGAVGKSLKLIGRGDERRRLRGVLPRLLGGIIGNVHADAVEAVREQAEQVTQPGAKLQQTARDRGGREAAHEARVIAPRKPVHAEAAHPAVGVIVGLEVPLAVLL